MQLERSLSDLAIWRKTRTLPAMCALAGNAVFRAGSDPANQILVLRWVFGNGLQEASVGPQGPSFAQSLDLHRPVVPPVGLRPWKDG
jgi:hypothetical protein